MKPSQHNPIKLYEPLFSTGFELEIHAAVGKSFSAKRKAIDYETFELIMCDRQKSMPLLQKPCSRK